MSAIFQVSDRAMCMNAVSSTLIVRSLYCVAEAHMQASGEQTLRLVGCGDDWYNSSRFARLPDPAARKWPRRKL